MKIAILGTAPQFLDAPFKDKDWQIWAVPGCYGVEEEKADRNNRLDRVYEIHSPENMAITCEKRAGFIAYAQGLKKNFILREPHPTYPKATVFNYQFYVKKHGRAPFSCSVSWMMAEAIEMIEKHGDAENEIGLWGVNMAHDTEYAYQKPGVRHLIGYAEGRGIKVYVPETSELMAIHALYGIDDVPPAFKIIRGRTKDLNEKLAHHEKRHQIEVQTINYMQGALNEHAFFEENPTQEEIAQRKAEIAEKFEHHKAQNENELRNVHIIMGAKEEHQWVENNFFRAR